jgi:Zinc dependent phospholipase C
MIQAVKFLPFELVRAKLEVFAFELDSGVLDPDINRIYDHKIKGAPGALNAHAKRAEVMIRENKPFAEIAFVLGQASHYIQDLSVPLHVTYDETRAEHAAYESVAYFREWPGDTKKYGYRGFKLVNDYKCFAYEAAERSGVYIQEARSSAPYRHVVEETWDSAVNDTINLLLSVFYKALGPEKSLQLYGIPAPQETVGNGKMCKW